MICDVVVTWPRNNDYPLWRQLIHDNRTRFNEVIVSFMETNQGEDYRQEVVQFMFPDYVHFVTPMSVPSGEDWRNVCVNAALMHSYNAPWIWFTEQDFFPKDGFWEQVEKLENEGCGVIAVFQEDRMHPCCIFIRREVLEQTRKNFGIVPNKSDHFSLIQEDLKDMPGLYVGNLNEKYYEHFNGLSHNWNLLVNGHEPNHQTDQFFNYLKDCLSVKVPMSKVWWDAASAGISKYYDAK